MTRCRPASASDRAFAARRGVRRQRQLGAERREQADQHLDVLAHERLAAGQAQLRHAQRDSRAGDALDLLEGQQFPTLEEAVLTSEHRLRHAVDTPEVAAVGDRDSQVAERASRSSVIRAYRPRDARLGGFPTRRMVWCVRCGRVCARRLGFGRVARRGSVRARRGRLGGRDDGHRYGRQAGRAQVHALEADGREGRDDVQGHEQGVAQPRLQDRRQEDATLGKGKSGTITVTFKKAGSSRSSRPGHAAGGMKGADRQVASRLTAPRSPVARRRASAVASTISAPIATATSSASGRRSRARSGRGSGQARIVDALGAQPLLAVGRRHLAAHRADVDGRSLERGDRPGVELLLVCEHADRRALVDPCPPEKRSGHSTTSSSASGSAPA